MVEVLKAGLYDSIQDLGRIGYQQFGVPISGAMDGYSAKLANAILGNSDDAAVLEFTLIAPKLKFHSNTAICITGMVSRAKINGQPIENNTFVIVKENDLLSFGDRIYGCRGYLAVIGGFQTEKVMQSRSFYTSITEQHRLKTGDYLKVSHELATTKNTNAVLKTPKEHFESTEIEVFKGIDYELIDTDYKNELFNKSFTVSSASNRMAYQLDERLENSLEPIITAPVLPGTVQLTPSGQLLILMRDCQTTGGYPRILQLSEMAINRLSQKTPGQGFRFQLSPH
ncbi:5-oxoprolinase subunit C family protein [Gelidibacter maritimus]|uniref:Biotin-dependent carboxyltransferase family protein n=1 Tax=Gelidibacter maritimus TaxID=2761487 RepID=A0A7W2R345_9FLAO|nr:biotin-dependent carboxyltransferase family protein [Gelidibacter maritimus]MBA6152471.1 biotin-dependent carboxyltransferase family protein [Gelidibacter maritimus]